MPTYGAGKPRREAKQRIALHNPRNEFRIALQDSGDCPPIMTREAEESVGMHVQLAWIEDGVGPSKGRWVCI
jgi:hypothetical protein